MEKIVFHETGAWCQKGWGPPEPLASECTLLLRYSIDVSQHRAWQEVGTEMESHNMWSFASGFFHLAQCFQGSPLGSFFVIT